MKLKNAVGKLFSHNETIALWYETDQHFKVLLWRGSAWKLSKEHEKLCIARFFGTIPQSICEADTINILIKSKPIHVGCSTCAHFYGTDSCPWEKECLSCVEMPHWEWEKSMWDERAGKETE